MNSILDLQLNDLKAACERAGEPAYRGAQVFGWLAKGVTSFDDMINVPRSLTTKLKEDYYICHPKVVNAQRSSDGTVKCLYSYTNSAQTTEVEAVFMKYSYGNSICISSQAGCRMGCTFCASTMDGLERNLSGGEMLAEVLAMKNYTCEDIGHVVIMGMGEPFDNYDEVSSFIKLIHDPKGYDLSMRNITVSTCGIVPYIKKFGEDFPQVNLAISLHAPNQELRERTMPVAKRFEYDDLVNACREYTEATRRRITFEYALIDGVNDSAECAVELAGHLKAMLAHVNLIPLNEVKGRDYRKSRSANVKCFKDILEQKGIAVTVRRTLGSDIDAACGQLRRRKK